MMFCAAHIKLYTGSKAYLLQTMSFINKSLLNIKHTVIAS